MTAELHAVDTGAPQVSETPAVATRGTRRPLLTPRRSNIILVVALAILLPALTSRQMPLALTQGNSQILAEAVAFAIAALSLNLLTGYAGQISLGHAALVASGAFAGGLATSRAGLPMWVALPVAAAATGAIALVIGFPALRLRGLYLAVVTIAFGVLMYQTVLRLDVLTGGSAGVETVPRLWGGTLLLDQSDLLAVALLVLIGVWLVDANVTRTRLGRAFRALKENEAVAQAMGIDVARHKLLAFVLSGAMAGLAGAVFGQSFLLVNSETFFYPVNYSLLLITMVVVGGLGSRAGAVIAAVAFSVFPFVVNGIHLPRIDGTQTMIGAALLMYTVARHPGGFAAVLRERREHRRKKSAAAAPAGDDEEPPMPALPRLPQPMPRSIAVAHHGDAAPVLDVANVTVRFGGLVAVDDASLQVHRGRIVGLIGPNGAGKTTLFNAISGLIRPQRGAVRLLGTDISMLPAHHRARLGLARTFQQIGLSKDQTVLENLLLAQHLVAGYTLADALLYTPRAARNEREMEERAREAIAALGFSGREDTPVRLLSHGQQRIVEVGCSLLCDPELLMLDEPSAGMSPAAVENLAERLRDLRDVMGRTVLLIEHNVPLVLDVCDDIYVLNSGRVLAHGDPDAILADPMVVGAYLGEAVA